MYNICSSNLPSLAKSHYHNKSYRLLDIHCTFIDYMTWENRLGVDESRGKRYLFTASYNLILYWRTHNIYHETFSITAKRYKELHVMQCGIKRLLFFTTYEYNRCASRPVIISTNRRRVIKIMRDRSPYAPINENVHFRQNVNRYLRTDSISWNACIMFCTRDETTLIVSVDFADRRIRICECRRTARACC